MTHQPGDVVHVQTSAYWGPQPGDGYGVVLRHVPARTHGRISLPEDRVTRYAALDHTDFSAGPSVQIALGPVLLEGGATVAEEAPEATPAEGDATATPAADSAADVAATTDAAAEGRVDPVAAAMAESAEAEQTGATGAAATDLVEDATTEVTDSGGDGTGKTEGDVKAEGAAAPAAADEPPKTARSDR